VVLVVAVVAVIAAVDLRVVLTTSPIMSIAIPYVTCAYFVGALSIYLDSSINSHHQWRM
jgi:hypothetical protein